MIIGVPKEIKNRERRVALTPEGAATLVAQGHELYIEQGAGTGSDFTDAAYQAAGVHIVSDAADAWKAELVVKVKEPLPVEYGFLRADMCLFTFLHLAAVPELAAQLLEKRVCAIGYETVQMTNGPLPLLAPMSRIAGRVAVQIGASLLQAENGTPFPGKGKLMGGIDGVPSAQALVLGGGNAGQSAAHVAIGMGAEVCVLDVSTARVATLNKTFKKSFRAELLDEKTMLARLSECDLLIGATLIAGEQAAHLLDEEKLAGMAGGVFVDIAIDQGGVSSTSRPTSYAEPVYVEAGVLHCCLPNLPACVPLSATRALTHATLPYVEQLAKLGIEAAIRDSLDNNGALALGVNSWGGDITHAGVAHALNQPYTPLEKAIG